MFKTSLCIYQLHFVPYTKKEVTALTHLNGMNHDFTVFLVKKYEISAD